LPGAIVVFCIALAQAQTAPAGRHADVRSALAQAGEDLTAGRFAEAASEFGAVLVEHPGLPEALFGFGVASGQLGRFEEARQALERYISLRPAAPEAHSALAAILLSSGRRSQAKSEFDRALQLEPNNLDDAKALARIELADFNSTRAAALLKPFNASSDFDDDARLLLAVAYTSGGEPRAALPLLAELVERRAAPQAEVFVAAAIAGSRAGDTEFSERACTAGLRAYLNSDDIEQRCLQVVSGGFVKNLEAGLHGVRGDFETLIILGRLMTDAVDNADSPVRERGLEFLQRAVALRPSDAGALYNLGRCLRVLARPGAAKQPLEQAISGHSDDPELKVLILTQLALTRQQLGQDGDADAAFRQAMDRNRALPRHLPSPAFEHYRFLDQAGRATEAAAIRDEILRWDAGFLPARIEQARSLAEAGRLKEAAVEAEVVARNADPSNAQLLRQAHLLLLQTYTKLGRKEDASRHQLWLNRARAAKQP
jgi:tetratricopeptide (TPR) repeat protein